MWPIGLTHVGRANYSLGRPGPLPSYFALLASKKYIHCMNNFADCFIFCFEVDLLCTNSGPKACEKCFLVPNLQTLLYKTFVGADALSAPSFCN